LSGLSYIDVAKRQIVVSNASAFKCKV